MIFHIPHASTLIPPEDRGSFVLNDVGLAAEVLAMTDHYTDELFGPLAEPSDKVVKSGVSRLVVDVERFPDDSQEIMAKKGMGVIYNRTSALEILRKPISGSERELLLDKYYHPHHQKLESCVTSELGSDGSAFVLDCHSFPSVALPYENDKSETRPDFCIGTDEYHTPAGLADLLCVCLTQQGYSVAVDSPFAGALVPLKFYRTDASVSALMIEVNRSLYMDEATGHKNESGFSKAQEAIRAVLKLTREYLGSE